MLNKMSKSLFRGVSDYNLLRIRWFGSGLLILGYFLILYVNVRAGVLTTLLSDVICLPYALRKNYWDVIGIIITFSVINVSKLLSM